MVRDGSYHSPLTTPIHARRHWSGSASWTYRPSTQEVAAESQPQRTTHTRPDLALRFLRLLRTRVARRRVTGAAASYPTRCAGSPPPARSLHLVVQRPRPHGVARPVQRSKDDKLASSRCPAGPGRLPAEPAQPLVRDSYLPRGSVPHPRKTDQSRAARERKCLHREPIEAAYSVPSAVVCELRGATPRLPDRRAPPAGGPTPRRPGAARRPAGP